MKISYRTTFADVAAFIWHHNTHSLFLLGLNGLASMFIAWSAMRQSAMEYGPVVTGVTFVLVVALLFSSLFLFGFICSALVSLSAKNKTFMTDNTIELFDDRFTTENRYGRSEHKWAICAKPAPYAPAHRYLRCPGQGDSRPAPGISG
jgi:hypothetical protein